MMHNAKACALSFFVVACARSLTSVVFSFLAVEEGLSFLKNDSVVLTEMGQE